MPRNFPTQSKCQKGRRPQSHKGWQFVVVCACLWLASCAQAVTPAAPAEKEVTQSASATTAATSTRVPTATKAATRTPAPSATATATPAEPLAITHLSAQQVGRYELLELDLYTDIVPQNPFDPFELELRVEFTSAAGKVIDVGAFWYQEYTTGGGKIGQPGWKARFTPTESGEWTAVARITGTELVSPPVSFSVVETGQPGFVRISPNNPRYFAFDDGSFFFPIGMNMAWWSGAGSMLDDYKKWMDRFSAHGGDTIRVWMAEWSFGIEWSNTPLGDYTNRLYKAWLLDQLFHLAEERDMYVLLVLLNCADYNDWQTQGWSKNPYNAKNGGPLENAALLMTDPTARALLQRRINYIANRWGYSPRLLAWEWWNEVNLAPFRDEKLIPWLQEMTAYLKSRDVNQHLVTNSLAISDTSPTWRLPEMEIIQKHEYALQEETDNKDLAERVSADLRTLVRAASPKPALLGEFGYGNEGWGKDIDKTGIHLHNGIWATTFAGYAGSGMYWFWDVYVEAYGVWRHYRGLEQFLKGVNLSEYTPFSPLEIRAANGTANGASGQATGLGLRSEDDVLIWLRSSLYTTQTVEAAWEQAGKPASFYYSQPVVKDQALTLHDMRDGVYTVRWFDPQTAKWLEAVEVTAESGLLVIPLPELRRDLAARILYN